MKQIITNYLRAGYPALYLVSPEEQRVEAELKQITTEIDFHLYAWSVTEGVVETRTGAIKPAADPVEALIALRDLPERSVTVLRDFHLFLGPDANPILVRQIKDLLKECKTRSKTIVFLGCRLLLPPELEREIAVLDFKLPGKPELEVVLQGILESAQIPELPAHSREAALRAASGLTTIEAENAFALSVVETKTISPEVIAREKAHALHKNGVLEVIESVESLDSIGGLDLLKNWLLQRREAFGERARAYGLPIPKGLLILGIPGTGKSLTAKATARVFGVPLLKLDGGRIFGSLVGQSEGNLRAAIQTAEAVSPCVLWIDEIEKAFSGSKSSGSTDGGTSARVFGSFISWMQEKTAPVFVVATANDVSQLPPEFLRKGRWDEMFFVDLPNELEREMIWRIQIQRFGRDPQEFDCEKAARATEGFTGSEIESVFSEALYSAFEMEKEPTDLSIAEVLTTIVPLSKILPEQISGMRKWAVGRARTATSQRPERRVRKLAVA